MKDKNSKNHEISQKTQLFRKFSWKECRQVPRFVTFFSAFFSTFFHQFSPSPLKTIKILYFFFKINRTCNTSILGQLHILHMHLISVSIDSFYHLLSHVFFLIPIVLFIFIICSLLLCLLALRKKKDLETVWIFFCLQTRLSNQSQ